jgi:ElaB/YqjD/DUF883 family membrane-anchored ribosome-binding protein
VKTRSIILAALVVVLVVLGIAQLRSCKLDKKYRDLKAAYETERNIANAGHALSVAHIEELNNAIGQADKTIVKLNGVIREKSVLISELSIQLDGLIDNEPPTTPEIESMPIVVSLRKQVGKLTEMYSLSQEVITLQNESATVLRGKFDAQVTISETWKQEHDKEHALRLSCESLLKLSERRVSNPWKIVKSVAVGVAAGFVAGSLLKK